MARSSKARLIQQTEVRTSHHLRRVSVQEVVAEDQSRWPEPYVVFCTEQVRTNCGALAEDPRPRAETERKFATYENAVAYYKELIGARLIPHIA